MTYVSTVCTSHSSHTFNGTVQHTLPIVLLFCFRIYLKLFLDKEREYRHNGISSDNTWH